MTGYKSKLQKAGEGIYNGSGQQEECICKFFYEKVSNETL
jgi:hypothetical protein